MRLGRYYPLVKFYFVPSRRDGNKNNDAITMLEGESSSNEIGDVNVFIVRPARSFASSSYTKFEFPKLFHRKYLRRASKCSDSFDSDATWEIRLF